MCLRFLCLDQHLIFLLDPLWQISDRTNPGDTKDAGSLVPAAASLVPPCDSMWSTRGKVTPLAETYTFSHFPTRLPNDATYSVLFLFMYLFEWPEGGAAAAVNILM